MRYLDTSFIAPYFLPEPTSAAIQKFMGEMPDGEIAISHWLRVEFASLLALRRRVGTLNGNDALNAEAQFDAIVAVSMTVFMPTIDDFDLARRYLSRHETGLRGGDALHLAIAANRRVEAVHSLDKTMLKAGATLGLPVSAGIR